MRSPRQAMVFAAGFGTRMGDLTRDRPKPLIQVAGRALIDHALDRVEEAGVTNVVINLHYRGDQIRAHLAGRSSPRVAYSDESDLIRETGGGLYHALDLFADGPVMTLNADAVWTGVSPLRHLWEAWHRLDAEALLFLIPKEQAVGHRGAGDFFLDADGRLRRRRDEPTAPYVFTGAQILDPKRILRHGPGVFSLNTIWDGMIEDGTLLGCVHDGGWADVGNPAGITRAERLIGRA